MSYADDLFVTKVKQAGYSHTTARRWVYEVLKMNDHKPQTMAELIAQSHRFADRASIYRSVKLLEEIGIIKRLQIGWKYKLELSDDFHGHHHHITCIKCGQTHATHDDEQFEKLLTTLARRHGYTITDHQLDIRGICEDCTLNK